ncbi:hypothetical protein [Nocardia crassostreae]|uniref:hypothetical protein n=1 Tax=Nocardia crassostreae TaxID=53428 RepID=UPI000829DB64|nr:hypothetical protein [Nocardia crassostreae]
MTLFPKFSDLFVGHVVNLSPGEQHKRFCANCDKVTEQISISYSDVPALRNFAGRHFAGRLFDAIPGVPLVGGKPTQCDCGHVTF